MNDKICNHCDGRITDGMDVRWNGGEFHPGCIGEAVLQHRADKQEDTEIKEVFEEWANDPPEDIADQIRALDFPEDEEENFDDLEPGEELEERRVIVPEVVQSDFRREVSIGEVVATATQNYIAARQPSNGSLIAGLKGSRFVNYPELKSLPMPDATSTFKPVPFYDFVTKLLTGLWDRRMKVVSDQYIISADGLKLFGLIELENEFNGVRFAIGLRTSNDKSTRLALAVGYKVMCCSNGMLSGDFLPLSVKHTANLELDDALALGIDRVRRRFGDLESAIKFKQEKLIEDTAAKEFIYNAFTNGKFPVSLFRTVHSEYFEKPSYDEFKPRTVFSLENAFTTSFKKLQPIQQFEQTARLGKFLTSLN